MSALRSKLLRGSVVLSSGQAVAYGASFLRNIILARVLTKADFGVAASFGMIVSFLEIASRMSIAQQVVQARDGDSERFQGSAQLFQFGLSMLSAVLMVVLSGLFAQAFKIPQTAWCFALLAVVPMCKGVEHLDVHRRARHMEFLPAVAVDVIPQVAITVVAFPVARKLGDYRAFVYLLVAKALFTLVLSHCFAVRRYRWRCAREDFRRMLGFGWPLVVNGFLMFAILQGDQFVVATYYAMADLAAYAVAGTLTLAPGFMLVHVVTSLLLPLFSRVQDDPEEFGRRYVLAMQGVTVGSCAMTVVLMVAGEAIVVLAFGPRYAGTGVLIAWMAAANAFRVMRAVPTLAAMAKADTANNLIQNLFRLLGLGLAVVVALRGLGLVWVAACASAGEGLAFLVSSWRLAQRHRVPVRVTLQAPALAGVFVVGSGFLIATGVHQWSRLGSLSLGVLLAGVATVLLCGVLPALRSQVLGWVRCAVPVDPRRLPSG